MSPSACAEAGSPPALRGRGLAGTCHTSGGLSQTPAAPALPGAEQLGKGQETDSHSLPHAFGNLEFRSMHRIQSTNEFSCGNMIISLYSQLRQDVAPPLLPGNKTEWLWRCQ